MTIYLVQHGLALSQEEDPSRGLSSEGRKQTEKVAEHLQKMGVRVRQVCHSGKKRAEETAKIFADRLSDGTIIMLAGMNPKDAVKTFAESIKNDNTMYIGHLPHLSKLASYLLAKNDDGDLVQFTNSGVVCLGRNNGKFELYWSIVPFLCPG